MADDLDEHNAVAIEAGKKATQDLLREAKRIAPEVLDKLTEEEREALEDDEE